MKQFEKFVLGRHRQRFGERVVAFHISMSSDSEKVFECGPSFSSVSLRPEPWRDGPLGGLVLTSRPKGRDSNHATFPEERFDAR